MHSSPPLVSPSCPNFKARQVKKFSIIDKNYACNTISFRLYSYTPSKEPKQDELEKEEDFEEEDDDVKKRNKSIRVNEKGISSRILPNQMVYKINPKTGEKRKVHEVAIGSFWMVKDLRDTQNKPVLSNASIIPAEDAQLFPPLKGLTSLTGERVDLPDFFIKHDGTSETSCTLVAISYKDFGYKMLPKWITPFERAFHQNPLASVVHLNITEGAVLKLLSAFLRRMVKNNTPEERHESTFLYYGNVESFRDVLRMHNTLTGYVVLLDGLGRVRWMGSGEPIVGKSGDIENGDSFSKELDVLIQSAKELIGDGDRQKKEVRGKPFSKHARKSKKSARVGRKTRHS